MTPWAGVLASSLGSRPFPVPYPPEECIEEDSSEVCRHSQPPLRRRCEHGYPKWAGCYLHLPVLHSVYFPFAWPTALLERTAKSRRWVFVGRSRSEALFAQRRGRRILGSSYPFFWPTKPNFIRDSSPRVFLFVSGRAFLPFAGAALRSLPPKLSPDRRGAGNMIPMGEKAPPHGPDGLDRSEAVFS
jgi:hypothetical protein